MRLNYIANIRFPTEKAHGYQIARVCTELRAQGVDVTLYVPRRRNTVEQPWHAFYGLPQGLPVVYVPCADLMMGNAVVDRIAFVIQLVTFAIALCLYGLDKKVPIMTRDKGLVWFFGILGFRVVFNAHRATETPATARMLARVAGVVANSPGTADTLAPIVAAPIVAIPNGSDENPYRTTTKNELRAELSLPNNVTIVLYSGHLYSWKGAETLFAAAALEKENPAVLFVCVGGLPQDVTKYRAKALEQGLANIRYLGHQEKSIVPKYLAAADILLLPNTDEHEESRTQTSPLKLFEYLAAGKPIIASDLPSLRAVVSDDEVVFVPSGDVEGLVSALTALIADPARQAALSAKSLSASERFTWKIHGASLKAFLETNVH